MTAGASSPIPCSPATADSSAAVRDTGATVFTKSATRFNRRGNFIPANPLTWKYIRRLPDRGMLNASASPTPGWRSAPRISGRAGEAGFKIIPNLYPEFIKGTDTAIQETLAAVETYRLHLGPFFRALELNYSCPNSEEAIAKNVVQALECTRKVQQPLSSALFNRQAQHLPPLRVRPGTGAHRDQRPSTPSTPSLTISSFRCSALPLVKRSERRRRLRGAGLPLALRYNQELRQKVDLFLIMGCGVTGADDVRRYFDLGADAVSLCTLALRKPPEAADIIRSY